MANKLNILRRDVGGVRWALLCLDRIAPAGKPGTYLSRVRIVSTPWASLYLHAIRQPDSDRALHDHPWSFFSLVLSGGYTETFAGDLDDAQRYAKGDPDRTVERTWRPGSIHRIRRDEYHAITSLRSGTAWTLLAVGPRRQGWGFATADGWVDHLAYESDQDEP